MLVLSFFCAVVFYWAECAGHLYRYLDISLLSCQMVCSTIKEFGVCFPMGHDIYNRQCIHRVYSEYESYYPIK